MVLNKYALIMAGGKGTRLWPISTSIKPKQFLNLYNENIMINETINRIKEIYDYKNIFIVVNKEQKELAMLMYICFLEKLIFIMV